MDENIQSYLSCREMHSLILSKLNCLYCSPEMRFFLNAARLERTSAVWGKEPIVVVGNRGRRKRVF